MNANGAIHDFVDTADIEDHLTWALDGAIELALLAGMSRAKLAGILAEEIGGVLDPLVALPGVAGSERQAEPKSTGWFDAPEEED